MGFQQGSLLKDECKEDVRAFLKYAENILSYNELLNLGNIMKDHITQEYNDELHGLADGAGVSFDDLIATNAAIEYLSFMQCFGIAAWNSATIDGKLYHARSWDLPLNIKDPLSGKYVHENSVLIVRKPDDGFASIGFSVAGTPNGAGGINEKGIGIGAHISWSRDQSFHGSPILIRIQMVLDHASNANEAIEIVNSNRTLGWNYIISDSKIPLGYIVETTANFSYIGTWDNFTESTYPFWRIDYVVRRTNFFIDPILASTQRDQYNPGGLSGFLKLLFTPNFFFIVWMNYKVTSKEILNQWGGLDLNNTISILQRVYSGKTNIFLALLKKQAVGSGFLEAWNQWVACTETGDIVVSFATHDKNACENQVHYFNMFNLLNSKPPTH